MDQAVIWTFAILSIAGAWRAFQKAGQPGWAIFIPIYNLVALLEMAGKPWWWAVLFFIPVLNIVVAMAVMIAVAKNFGQGAWFGLGLAFLGGICWPILGFGKAEFCGRESRTQVIKLDGTLPTR